MLKKLHILTGTTAVGKTEIAIKWALENNAEILSCDSLLFYKGMDIGTAKPTAQELNEVKHHGINIVAVYHNYNIKEYIDYAKEIIRDIHSREKKVLIVGGSGFYLKAFLAPVVDEIEVSKIIKEKVDKIFENQGPSGLLQELDNINKQGTGDLDRKNPRRVMKALQRCLATGKSCIELKESFEQSATPFDEYDKDVVLLQREPDDLKIRIVKRVERMFELGLVEEVRRLIGQGIKQNPSAASAIGYREVIKWIENGANQANLNLLKSQIVQNTNKLVAKQRKWFRTQLRSCSRLDVPTI